VAITEESLLVDVEPLDVEPMDVEPVDVEPMDMLSSPLTSRFLKLGSSYFFSFSNFKHVPSPKF
jgi:hypothetical protein